jgi:hypothetical protein
LNREVTNTLNDTVQRALRKKLHGTPVHRWEDNIKMDVRNRLGV